MSSHSCKPRWLTLAAAATIVSGLGVNVSAGDISAPTAANDSSARVTQLAQSPAWLKLLHYRNGSFATGFEHAESQVDFADFFLSETGKTDALAELNATIKGLQAPVTADQLDEHVACRFPARAALITKQLGLTNLPITDPVEECPDFNYFMNRWQPEQVTVIFADAFLNNPASAFGHTFLRLDPAPDADGEPQPTLLNGTIDFAAHTGDATGFAYAFNGLIGRFDGRFSVLPYYIQVNNYNYGALRDLWEYPLYLSAAERYLLMAHLWELRDTTFEYYFLDENCSGQLLALLEAVKPELNILGDVGAVVIPGELVRVLAAEPDLLGKPTFRPALDSVVLAQGDTLNAAEKELALRLAEGRPLHSLQTELQQYSALQQARILDVAYDLLRIQEQNKSITTERFKALGRPLLLARAQISVKSDFPAVTPPTENPANGHGAARLRLAAHHQDYQTAGDQATTATLGWRLSFHDLLDPRLDNPRGNEVRVLDTEINVNDGHVRLTQLDLVSLRALTPRSDLLKPWSWQLSFGYRNRPSASLLNNGQHYFEYGRGFTWDVDLDLHDDPTNNRSKQHLAYVLGVGKLSAGNQLEHAWRLDVGVQAGWLYTPNPWHTTQLELDVRDGIAGDDQLYASIKLSQQFSFASGLGTGDIWGLRGSVEHFYRDGFEHMSTQHMSTRHTDRRQTEFKLSLEWYL